MTPEQYEQRHLQTIRHFRPDWGRTTRDCETCGGNGRHEGQTDSLRRCLDCNGHGTVFREWVECPGCVNCNPVMSVHHCDGSGLVPDAEGRRWIAEARAKYAEYRASGERAVPDDWRDFVRKYKPEVPDLLTTDGCELLKRLLRDAGMSYDIKWLPATKRHGVTVNVNDGCGVYLKLADTEPEALLAAAAKAARGGDV